MNLDLHYSVVDPLLRLTHRLQQNMYAEALLGDVTEQAKATAISMHHYRERASGRGAYDDAEDERTRQIVCDVADSAKHGQLTIPERTVQVSSHLAFEFNAEGLFRFREIRVEGRNGRFGQFDLWQTLARYSGRLAEDAGWRLELEVRELLREYDRSIVTYVPADDVTPKSRLAIITERRDAAGVLAREDPSNLNIEIRRGEDPHRVPRDVALARMHKIESQ